MKITKELAEKVLETVDAGLCSGLGNPIPGQMCVEAAVCYAMGMEHSDEPICVAESVRSLKIKINDSCWSSNDARAKGLRRLAIAQLGSSGVVDDSRFVRMVVELVISKQLPLALRAAASVHPDKNHKSKLLDAAIRCEKEKSTYAADAADYAADAADYAAANAADAANAANAAYAAYAADAAYAAYAADAAADAAYSAAYAAADAADAAAGITTKDEHLSEFCEDVVQILIELKSPGCEFLELTE